VRVWLLGPGSEQLGLAWIGNQAWEPVVSADLPPALGSCQVPVWANLASEWRHDLWRILAVSVGLPPEPGFALEQASGLPARGCIGADRSPPPTDATTEALLQPG
jgi:hypothetical protein